MIRFPRNRVVQSPLGNLLACWVLFSSSFMLWENRGDFMCNGSGCRKNVLQGIIDRNGCENWRQLGDIYVFKVCGYTTVTGKSFSQKENLSSFVCGMKIAALTFRYPQILDYHSMFCTLNIFITYLTLVVRKLNLRHVGKNKYNSKLESEWKWHQRSPKYVACCGMVNAECNRNLFKSYVNFNIEVVFCRNVVRELQFHFYFSLMKY